MNFTAYQQVENYEKEFTLGSAVTPWRRSMRAISVRHLEYGAALFSSWC